MLKPGDIIGAPASGLPLVVLGGGYGQWRVAYLNDRYLPGRSNTKDGRFHIGDGWRPYNKNVLTPAERERAVQLLIKEQANV